MNSRTCKLGSCLPKSTPTFRFLERSKLLSKILFLPPFHGCYRLSVKFKSNGSVTRFGFRAVIVATGSSRSGDTKEDTSDYVPQYGDYNTRTEY